MNCFYCGFERGHNRDCPEVNRGNVWSLSFWRQGFRDALRGRGRKDEGNYYDLGYEQGLKRKSIVK